MRNKINTSIERANSFLKYNSSIENESLIKKCSSFHNINKFPDMKLVATYNATHALILTGEYNNLELDDKNFLIDFFNSYQNKKGYFELPQIKENEIWKGNNLEYTKEYLHNHVTNYCLGAIKSLNGNTKYPISYVHPYLSKETVLSYLNQRKISDPWLEGNNIVNTVSFIINEEKNTKKLNDLIDVIIDWHNKTQDPLTGYWGTNHREKPASLLEGMAGAAHNYHIYYYFNKEIPNYKKIIDSCLYFISKGVQSACIDVDIVDILVNMIPYNYKVNEIKSSLNIYLKKLLDFQNTDGGFADEKTNTVRRMDGWVSGYWEPQGLSNCFATWFRLITIALIEACLYGEQNWTFRNTIGIGYYNNKYLRG